MSTTSQLLPVSILAGPSGREFVRDAASLPAKGRFGLLASSNVDPQLSLDRLMVEKLAGSGDGYNPERIRAQIAAIADKALIDHLIIECDAKTHPIAFASLFLPNGSAGERFSEIACLSSILVAVDSETLLDCLVRGKRTPGVTSACAVADQIECASILILGGAPADRDFVLARDVASTLNPEARIISESGEASSACLLDTGTAFDFEVAFGGAGWRKLMEQGPEAHGSDHGGVTAFVYRARRPFHPERFWNLIQSPFPGVFRAKGFFWLATRMSLVGGLNIAGAECHHSPAGQWWVAGRDGNGESDIPDRLKKEWAEPFGDRRQAITFMGIDVDPAKVNQVLDSCLLDDAEMKLGERGWAALPDPFPAWSSMPHDHECEGDDCCHH